MSSLDMFTEFVLQINDAVVCVHLQTQLWVFGVSDFPYVVADGIARVVEGYKSMMTQVVLTVGVLVEPCSLFACPTFAVDPDGIRVEPLFEFDFHRR